MSLIELQEGKYYWSRSGEVFGPLRFDEATDTAYKFDLGVHGDRIISWLRNGREHMFDSDGPNDLVAEAPDYGAATTGAQQAPSSAADPVNHPVHYTAGGIECIDAIQAAVGPEQFKGYLRGNVLKYLWRYEHKGGVESLLKAQWYLDRLIQANA